MKRLVCLFLAAAAVFAAALPVRAASAEAEKIRSATPGERVDCRAVFRISGERGYVVRGRFSDGVDLQSVTALSQGGEPVNASFYTILERTEHNSRLFEIHLAPGWAERTETSLEIEYTVSLNDRAGLGERDNRCHIELTDADGTPVTDRETYVRTGAFACYRALAIPDSTKQANPVSGACFSLYRDREGTQRVAFAAGRGGVYTACTGENCRHTRHTCLIKTPENGTLQLRGLGAGTYYLQETRPPQGCTVTADRLEVVLGEDGSVTAGGVDMPEGVVRLIEQKKTETAKAAEDDPLAFYERGCRILSAALGALLMAHRRLFR